jgi:dihydrofolate synthase/folylpolyglutamate synthase
LENELCVLTHIALDHTNYLGNSIEEITRVKSGIIKRKSKVVTLINNGDISIIKNKCNETQSELFKIPPFEKNAACEGNEVICYKGEKIKLSLKGINQLENSALAVKCAEILDISYENIKKGLETACIKGRFEEIFKNVYFDGAHNKNGIKALKQSILRYFGNSDKAFLMGVMADKDFEGMLDELKEIGNDFYFVTVKNNPRAMQKERMQEIAKNKGIECEIYDNINEGILNIKTRPLFVCGSLYMYKDINFSLEMNKNG